MPEFTLERLVFDALKCDPTAAQVRDLAEMKAGSESPDLDNLSESAKRLLSEAEDAASVEALRGVWTAINPLLKSKEISDAEAGYVDQRIQQLSQQMAVESNGVAA